jgi:hypothetical protein
MQQSVVKAPRVTETIASVTRWRNATNDAAGRGNALPTGSPQRK